MTSSWTLLLPCILLGQAASLPAQSLAQEVPVTSVDICAVYKSWLEGGSLFENTRVRMDGELGEGGHMTQGIYSHRACAPNTWNSVNIDWIGKPWLVNQGLDPDDPDQKRLITAIDWLRASSFRSPESTPSPAWGKNVNCVCVGRLEYPKEGYPQLIIDQVERLWLTVQKPERADAP